MTCPEGSSQDERRARASRVLGVLAAAATAAGVAVALAALAFASTPEQADFAAGEVTVAAADKRDWGDARDGPNGDYPALKSSKGASHTTIKKVLLGSKVDKEFDSRQIDRDEFDDGFEHRIIECQESKFRFEVNLKQLKKKKPELFRGKKGKKNKIYLNAWFDWTLDLDWRDDEEARCGDDKDDLVPEWRVENEAVKLKDLKKEPKQVIEIKKIGGPLAAVATAPYCYRATITLNQKFKRKIKPPGEPGKIVNDGRGRFRHGETEDYCQTGPGPGEGPPTTTTTTTAEDPPPSTSTTSITDPPPGTTSTADSPEKCGDGVDNDGDGLIDSNDPGCNTGPGGVYDPDDHGEDDLTGQLTCPEASQGLLYTIVQNNVGSTMLRHILRINGGIVVERAPSDGDFDAGSLPTFTIVCQPSGGTFDVDVSWTRNETTITYQVAITHKSGPGGGFIVKSAAANTR